MLNLDFHHHTILVRSNQSDLLKKLQEEFHFFVIGNIHSPAVTINLKLEAPPELPPMVASKITETATIYHQENRQYIDYSQEAQAIWDRYDNKIEIFSLNPDRLFELSFLAIHSLIGERLDRDGLCRLHAVAISLGSTNAIIMLPSKGGKSTLLEKLLETPDVKIISDDTPLCNTQGNIYPFPSKVSLNEPPQSGPLASLKWNEFTRTSYPPKWTASLSQLVERIDPHPENNKNILIAGFRLSSGEGLLLEVSKWKMVKPMIEHMIVGIGLPQIIEMFLKFKLTDLVKLPYHAAIRTICAVQLVRKAKCYYIYLGPDKDYNAKLVIDVINENSKA